MFTQLFDLDEDCLESGQSKRLLAEGLLVLCSTPILLLPTLLPSLSILCCLVIFVIWILRWFADQIPFVLKTPLTTIWTVLGLSTVAGVFVSADGNLTFPDAATFFISISWWRLLSQVVASHAILKLSTIFVILIGVAITGFGVISIEWPQTVPLLEPLVSVLRYSPVTLPDASGSLGVSPNSVAATLLLFLPLVVSLLFNSKKRFSLHMGILILLAIVGYSILLLTQSRGGWIGAVSGFIILIALDAQSKSNIQKKNFSRVLLSITSIAVMFGILAFGPARFVSLWTNPPTDTFIGSLSTLNFRREVWSWGLIALGDFPITGTGFGAFRNVVHRLYPISIPITYDIGHAHNQLLQVGLDTGILGLISYSAMLGVVGWMCIEISKRSSLQRAVGHGIFAIIIGFHVWGFGDALLLGAKPMLLYWMVTGIVTGAYVNLPLSV